MKFYCLQSRLHKDLLTNLSSVDNIFSQCNKRKISPNTSPLLCVMLGISPCLTADSLNQLISKLLRAHPYIFLSGCKNLLLNRPNSPLIYRSCKEYSTSHNLLLVGIQFQAVKTFMAFPGGVGTQVAFSLPQLIKREACLGSLSEPVIEGVESRSPFAQYTSKKHRIPRSVA